MKFTVIEYSITLNSPLHIASGLEAPGYADRIVLRDKGNMPYIPGSSLKGALRAAVTRLGRTLSVPECGGAECSNPKCLLCRLFGSVKSPGLLRFGDARIATGTAEEPFDPAWFSVRNGVQICRQRRIAREGLLYNLEYADVPSDQVFTGHISGWVGDDNLLDMDLPPTVWALLCGLRLVDKLGGNRSRGAGSVRIEATKILLNGEAVGTGALGSIGLSPDLIEGYAYALQEEVAA